MTIYLSKFIQKRVTYTDASVLISIIFLKHFSYFSKKPKEGISGE